MYKFIFICVLSMSFGRSAVSGELSQPDQEAVVKTEELLNSRSKRQEVINDSSKAKSADDMARKLMGDGQELDDLYKAASEIFRNMASQNQGDGDAMSKQLEAAQGDPEAFYNSLTDEQKAMISNLANKVKANKQPPNH